MASVSLVLATQEMQGLHVYVLGAIAVGAVGALIYALVHRLRRNLHGRTQSDGYTTTGLEATPPDTERDTAQHPNPTRPDRGRGA